MDEGAKSRTVENIVGAMKPVEREDIKIRATLNFYKADAEFGERIAKGLGIALPQEVK
jgi:catalase